MNGTLEITSEALAALKLPAQQELDDGQRRGATCVWCGYALNAESAVDLGEREPPERWFPRACRPCTGRRAHSGFFDHVQSCGHCAHRPTLCETGRLLNRLTLRHWVSCGRCGDRIEPGRPYDAFVPESATGFPPTVYTHREPCKPGPASALRP
ncbi:hypothetical protein [Streptomyces sp. bgisy159]|uniref:hypothetical protein n=1 Tax=Streptomyces sp. bgisy159 TaxID=3413795 RepID=UPI003F4A07F5